MNTEYQENQIKESEEHLKELKEILQEDEGNLLIQGRIKDIENSLNYLYYELLQIEQQYQKDRMIGFLYRSLKESK